MAPLAVLMLVLGFAPNAFLAKSEPAAQFLLDTIEQKHAAALEAAHAQAPMARAVFDGDAFVLESQKPDTGAEID